MSFYPTISKSDVADAILDMYQGPVRDKIDEWTNQCMLELLEWFKDKGGNAAPRGLSYVNDEQGRTYCTPQELINAFKTGKR